MPLRIVRNDITQMHTDAIANPTDERLSGAGGADLCVHEAAGPDLDTACRALGGCAVGRAVATPGFRLPARYIFHTVGPVWKDGHSGEADTLRSCYRSVLHLAAEKGCETLSIPLLATGTFGFPKDLALEIAVEEISAFLLKEDLAVWIVVFDKESYQISGRLFADIAEYICDRSVQMRARPERAPRGNLPPDSRREWASSPLRRGETEEPVGSAPAVLPSLYPADHSDGEFACCASAAPMAGPESAKEEPLEPLPFFGAGAAPKKAEERVRKPEARSDAAPGARSLEEAVDMIDESFSEMLLRKIDEKGMTDAECYRRANIDRRLFSKIRSNPAYRPSKPTALAFAVALELPMDEVDELLLKAGFALSRSSRFDIIVEYFIAQGNYNLFEINEALFQFDQPLLGG